MKATVGELNTRVSFFEFTPNDGPEPGESERNTLFSCWARVEKVWMKDMERAKENGTLEDVTLLIRDTRGDYFPNNKHYLSIDDRQFEGNRYNIKTVQPDLADKRFITVVAGVVT